MSFFDVDGFLRCLRYFWRGWRVPSAVSAAVFAHPFRTLVLTSAITIEPTSCTRLWANVPRRWRRPVRFERLPACQCGARANGVTVPTAEETESSADERGHNGRRAIIPLFHQQTLSRQHTVTKERRRRSEGAEGSRSYFRIIFAEHC